MLLELKIKHFIIIDELNLKFNGGLNILTGETGAGKSIIIDALSALMGAKITIDFIRKDFEKSIIEGIFDISNLRPIKMILTDSGIDFDNEILVLKRELYLNGKGRCFANSTQIPISRLKEISDYLIDIHGQNEHQNIIKISKHRELLDNFSGHYDLVDDVNRLYYKLKDLKEKINSFEINKKDERERKEYLSFVINEIESAELIQNEDDDLINQSKILLNAEKIFNELNNALVLLNDDIGIIQKLQIVEQGLSSFSGYDSNISSILEIIKESLYSLQDASSMLRDYKNNIDFSPDKINVVEERLSLISNLKRKYGNSIIDILKYASNAKKKINALISSDEEIEILKEEYFLTIKETKEKALALSQKRILSAKRLEDGVMNELKDLAMASTIFKVSIEREASPDGEIEENNKRYVLNPYGLDKIEFFISTNKGEDLKQLRKIASGGELSRIMLALKRIILSTDIVESLIFDEVDSGIGGKIAEIVGTKLKSLSKTRQIIVITHLPQIAAMSDNHFTVKKETLKGRSITNINQLDRTQKVEEIARMLAGKNITDLSIKHAEEMVSFAEKNY